MTDTPAAAREKGVLYDRSEVRQRIIGAHRAGWQIAVHAQGDAAIEFTLDCLEEAQKESPRDNARHRIEHCSVTTDAAVERIAALGVVPSPQGRFVGAVGDGQLALFDQDLPQIYRMRSYLDRGITVAGSSDRPCTEGTPLKGIHDMVNRKTDAGADFNPQEAVTAQQRCGPTRMVQRMRRTWTPGWVLLRKGWLRISQFCRRTRPASTRSAFAISTSLRPL